MVLDAVLKTGYTNNLGSQLYKTLVKGLSNDITDVKHSKKMLFQSLNLTTGFKEYFSFLWYSSLPCFDVKGITADENGESAILKKCFWKSQKIKCAAIFKKVPTDNVR